LWDDLYPNLKISIKEIMEIMIKYRYECSFALLGLDFIFDVDKKPWILEMNTYPNLYYEADKHLQPILNEIMNATLDIIVYKRNSDLCVNINI
jgi:D-alanine-D-alanine ligase-like ATP-grasp enzyme